MDQQINTEAKIAAVTGFAAAAHEGQVRKYADEPYIQHPVRVMQTCRRYTDDADVLAAALLHDVLEDTGVTEEELTEFLTALSGSASAARTIALVKDLTDVYTRRRYPQWNRRKRKAAELERLTNIAADAQTVKYADILDNSVQVDKEDPGFARVLLNEYRLQLQALTQGNPLLRKLASDEVAAALGRL